MINASTQSKDECAPEQTKGIFNWMQFLFSSTNHILTGWHSMAENLATSFSDVPTGRRMQKSLPMPTGPGLPVSVIDSFGSKIGAQRVPR